jgi:predicted MPP superfamily phosphohydrolase
MSPFQHAQRTITRRRFLAGTAIAAGSLLLYAGEIERHALMTVQHTVFIKNLPTAFHGFRIAQLSDIHFHEFDEPYFVEHAVRAVNRLKPDMVAVTGDFITAHHGPIATNLGDADACAAILSGINCGLRYCSLGNHDAFLGPQIRDILRRHGLTPLNNEFTALDLRGDRLWIAGLADAYFDVPNLTTAIPKRRTGEPIILLGHEPDFVDTVAATAPVDLMLAGHTHGGQVRIPLVPPILLPALGVKYVEGLFQAAAGTQVYVNRGLGCMHLPFRFNCPPELTLLTLQPA